MIRLAFIVATASIVFVVALPFAKANACDGGIQPARILISCNLADWAGSSDGDTGGEAGLLSGACAVCAGIC